MTIKFQNCAFSPNSPATPEIPLSPGKIHLLQQGQPHDISSKVGDLVTRYFGHNTPDAFRLTLSRNQITFTVNGQTRTLRNVPGSGWTLTNHDGSTAPALAPELQSKIEGRIGKILEKIQLANSSSDPAAAPSAPSSPAPAPTAAAAALPVVASPAPDLNALRTQLETLQTAILQSQAGMTEQLRQLVEFARELLGRLERNAGSAAEFHQELARLSAEAQTRIHQLTEENERLHRNLDDLGEAVRRTAKNQQINITELMDRVETLNDQLKDKDRELKALQKTLGPLQEQLNESLKTEGSRATILLDLDAKVRELDQKNAAQLKRNDELEAQLREAQSNKQLTIQVKDRELEETKAQLEQMKRQLNSLQEQLETAQAASATATQELAKATASQKESSDLSNQSALQAEKRAVELETRLNAKIRDLEQAAKDQQAQARQIELQLAAKQGSHGQLEKSLAALQEKFEDKESELTKAAAAQKQLSNQHQEQSQARENRIQALTAEASRLGQELLNAEAELKKQKVASVSEIEALKTAKSEENRAAQERLRSLEASAEKIQAELTGNQRALAKEQQEARQLEETYKQKFTAQAGTIQTLESQSSQAKEKLAEAQAQLDGQTKFLAELQARLKQMESELTEKTRLAATQLLQARQESIAVAQETGAELEDLDRLMSNVTSPPAKSNGH